MRDRGLLSGSNVAFILQTLLQNKFNLYTIILILGAMNDMFYITGFICILEILENTGLL